MTNVGLGCDTSGANGTSLKYSTYLSGSVADGCEAIALDNQGQVYLTGAAFSPDFPTTTNGFQPVLSQSLNGLLINSAFVVQLDTTQGANGLLYGSYLGGGNNNQGADIAVDSSYNVYITGQTDAPGFPGSLNGGGPQTPLGGSDAFVVEIDPTGTNILYACYLGGSGQDQGTGIALDGAGNVYVTGVTYSHDFPATSNALQPAFPNADSCAFVSQINPGAQQLVYSSFFGGTTAASTGSAADTSADGIATWTDPGSGKVYVYLSGVTNASASASGSGVTAFPIHNALPANGSYAGGGVYGGGNSDAFVAKFDLTMTGGDALLYSTYLGGSGDEDAAFVAVDALGAAYVCGDTNSVNFPTTQNCDQANNHGGFDAFVAKIVTSSSNQTSLAYSTYLGGSQDDHAYRVALDSAGNVYLTGYTGSTDFPTSAQAFQPHLKGFANAFVTCLNASGSALVYSTYLGGSLLDLGLGIAVDGSDNAFVTGATVSWDFPTVNPLQSQNYLNGTATGSLSADAFVTEVNSSGTSLLYSTYLGGSGTNEGSSVKVDAYDNAYVVGYTTSPDFPVTNTAILPFGGGGSEAFVTKLSPQNSSGTGAPVCLQSVTLTPSIVQGGGTVTGTVTLTGPAPSPNGATVQLVSSQPGLAQPVPTSVAIAPNATSGTFVLPTRAVSAPTQVLITGTYGCPQTAQLLVTPGSPTSSPQLLSVTLNPSTVTGGNSTTGTVTLTSAPATGTTVNVLVSATSLTNVASVSTSSVAITGPNYSGTFTVTTQTVTTETSALIQASLNGIQQNAVLTVVPQQVQLVSLTLDPTTVSNGGSSTGTVTLSGNAPPSGIVVSLSNGGNSNVSMPSSVPVAPGAPSAQFTIITQAVATTQTATISAVYAGITQTANLTLEYSPCVPNVPGLSSMALTSNTVVGGSTLHGTVNLTGPVAAPGTTLVLFFAPFDTSTGINNSNLAASAPQYITIAGGQSSVTFTISTTPVVSAVTYTLIAGYDIQYPNPYDVAALLTVNPQTPLTGLTLTPYGYQEGFQITTYASGLPTATNGMGASEALCYGQQVLVSDSQGSVLAFSSALDGQNANNVIPAPYDSPAGMTTLNGAIYLALPTDGKVIQINPAGVRIQDIATGLTTPTGIAANPATGHLYVSSGASGQTIWDINPSTPGSTPVIFASDSTVGGPTGLAVTSDGKSLFACYSQTSDIVAFDIASKTKCYDYNYSNEAGLNPQLVNPVGIVLGAGAFNGYLYVSTQGGNIYEVNYLYNETQMVATGGTQGELISPDPNGSALIAESDRIMRISPVAVPLYGSIYAPPGSLNSIYSAVIHARDDLNHPGGTTYSPLALTQNNTTVNISPQATFDMAGLTGRVFQATMQRAGLYDWNAVADNITYVQLGVAASNGFVSFSSGYDSVSNSLDNNPNLGTGAPPLPYLAVWQLPSIFYSDIQEQFGQAYLVTLADQLYYFCGSPTVIDTPEGMWPSPYLQNSNNTQSLISLSGGHNTLNFALAPNGNPAIGQGQTLDITLPGADAPLNGVWDIVYQGAIIASSESPNGWSVEVDWSGITGISGHGFNNGMNLPGIWVTASSQAAAASGYEVRVAIANSTSFSYPSPNVARQGSAFFDVVSAGSSNSAPELLPLSVSPNGVIGTSSPLVATVMLDAPAPEGGATVTLYSQTMSVPPSVFIGANQRSAQFNIPYSLSQGAGGQLFAYYNGTREIDVAVYHPGGSGPSGPSLTATGGPALVMLNWTRAAGYPDYYVIQRSTALGGPYSTLATVPAYTDLQSYVDMLVTPGTTYYYIVTAVNAYGQANSNPASATPSDPSAVSLLSVVFTPNPVGNGDNSTGIVTLNGPAPEGGATVHLHTDSSFISFPQASSNSPNDLYITILQGNMSQTFTVHANDANLTSEIVGYVTATYNGCIIAPLTIEPLAVTGLTFTPNPATGGSSVTGTVTLSGSGGAAVTLSDNNSASVGLPSGNTVMVQSGTNQATFSLTTSAVTAVTNVPITASLDNTSQTATLVLQPAMNPQIPQGGSATFPSIGTDAPASGLTWDIILNGSTVANNTTTSGWTVTLDGTSHKFTVSVPLTAQVAKNYEVRYTGSYSALFDVIPIFTQNKSAPGWAEYAIPRDANGSGGEGPSDADYVNLATGVYENRAGADIVARNPVGPDVVYSRMFHTLQAALGYSSPGLPTGWVDNYDITIQGAPLLGGPLSLVYPNGASEPLTPVFVDGAPTGVLTPPTPKSPYMITGTFNTTQWLTFTVTFKDQSQWNFTPDPNTPGRYLLSNITRLMSLTNESLNQHLYINRDTNNFITSITNDNNVALLTFSYNGGLLSALTDTANAVSSNQRQITYGYDQQAGTTCLQTVSEVGTPGGLAPPTRWTYAYASVNNWPFLTCVTVPDPRGNGGTLSNGIAYDAVGRVSYFMDANGNQRLYAYNGSNTTITVEDANNTIIQTMTENLNSNNTYAGETDANGKTDVISYGDTNPFLPTQFMNRNMQSSTDSYDPYGNIMQTVEPLPNANDIYTTTYSYQTDPFLIFGRLQTATYQGVPVKLTYYDGTTQLNGAVQPYGAVQSVTSPQPGSMNLGNYPTVTTTYTYTALGNVATVMVPSSLASGAPVTYTYNYTSDPQYNISGVPEALGEPLTVTDPLNHTVHYRYDARGRITASIDALGNETDYAYDPADSLTTVTYPATGMTGTGRAYTSYSYLYPGGPLLSIQMYDEGNQGLLRTVNYKDGREGEPSTQMGDTQNAQFTFDPQYRLNQLIDGNHHATVNSYDAVGNLNQLSLPRATSNVAGSPDTLSGQFDDDYNLKQVTDGRGNSINYTLSLFDNSVTNITYPTGTLGPVTYAYDPTYGRISQVTDDSGTRMYTYDLLGDLISIDTTYNGLAGFDLQQRYTYYPNGQRQQLAYLNHTLNYLYDAAGRLTDVQSDLGNLHYDYDAGNRLIHQCTPTLDTVYTYDARNELTSQVTRLVNVDGSLGATLAQFTGLTYDGVGNRTGIQSQITLNATTNPATITAANSYAYSATDRLSSESLQQSQANQGVQNLTFSTTYAADPADNLTTLRGSAFTYNADNQPNLSTLAYDGDGNPTAYPIAPLASLSATSSLGYDVEDRLTSIGSVYGFDVPVAANGSTSMSMGYRSDGLRAWKQDGADPNLRVYYFYDGAQVLEELQSYYGGTNNANYNHVYDYEYGAAGLARRVYTMTNGTFTNGNGTYPNTSSGVMDYVFDPNGSVVEYMDTGQCPSVASWFDAFGVKDYGQSAANVIIGSDPVGYKGQYGYYTDVETGLLLLGYRFYDPWAARFLTRDPIGYDGGINVYAYVQNNPIMGIDPLGLDDKTGDWLFDHIGHFGADALDYLKGRAKAAYNYAEHQLGRAADYVDRNNTFGQYGPDFEIFIDKNGHVRTFQYPNYILAVDEGVVVVGEEALAEAGVVGGSEGGIPGLVLGRNPTFKELTAELSKEQNVVNCENWLGKLVHEPTSPRFGRIFSQAAQKSSRIHFALDNLEVVREHSQLGTILGMETRKPYPSDMTDKQFELIDHLLPKQRKTGRKPTISRREILNAILYKVKTGCQWRALPHDLPHWKTVHTYFSWWTIDGTLDAILTALRETVRLAEGREATPSAGIIDSQSVKTTAYGGEEGTIGVDGNKRVNGRKRHILVDVLGIILAVVVTAANVPDRVGAKLLAPVCARLPRLKKIWVDGSYTGDVKDFYQDKYNIDFEIVEKPPDQKGFVVSPKRWVVERTFGWLGWYRGLSRDYEFNPRHSESMVKLASIHLMLRRLEPPQKS